MMRKILMACVTLAFIGVTPVFAQSAPTAAPADNSNSGMNVGDQMPSSNGASSGEMGNAGGSPIETPTAPQEKQDLKQNPDQVPPSQRVDPEKSSSPSSNGTSQ